MTTFKTHNTKETTPKSQNNDIVFMEENNTDFSSLCFCVVTISLALENVFVMIYRSFVVGACQYGGKWTV